MDSGCKLADLNHKCTKYGCACDELIRSKMMCPVWAEAFEIQEYYNRRFELDRYK